MKTGRLIAFAGIAAAASVLVTSRASAVDPGPDRTAVEAVVRDYEQAIQEFDFKRADSMLAPGAVWIEDSKPLPADYFPQWWHDAKAAGVRIINRPHDFTTHVQGSVAWVTLFVDVTCLSENAKSRQMCADNFPETPRSDPDKFINNYVESEVLVKAGAEWHIAMGHTSRLP